MTDITTAHEDTELFGDGWLIEQLDELMDELAVEDEKHWPRLTGWRSASQPEIDADLRRRRKRLLEG